MNEIMPTNGQFAMPELAYNELHGTISQQTLEFHCGKHLRTYVDNLNRLLPDSDFEGKSLQEVVRHAQGALYNNSGQALNHIMYFSQFSLQPSPMSEHLKSLIERDFGSVEAFMQKFEQQGAALFGSGWVWLTADEKGHLAISQCPNADNPLVHGMLPLLTFDVWEHAYYLDYQNRRADYLSRLWSVVDWSVIESRLTA